MLERSCRLMSLHCGNHEELEALEAILDWLSDADIITEEQYARIVRETDCGRWL